ncbi:hypothetical protein ACT3UD_07805 [Glutamicibacter sp. 287]|uniref:hypothetical protein n=1 Tax=unclassified Glutamicibacter TaxID=2627139 RepID=UPI0011430252|nr:hypothetical protein [Glutamicibacter sp. BW80]
MAITNTKFVDNFGSIAEQLSTASIPLRIRVHRSLAKRLIPSTTTGYANHSGGWPASPWRCICAGAASAPRFAP